MENFKNFEKKLETGEVLIHQENRYLSLCGRRSEWLRSINPYYSMEIPKEKVYEWFQTIVENSDEVYNYQVNEKDIMKSDISIVMGNTQVEVFIDEAHNLENKWRLPDNMVEVFVKITQLEPEI